MSEKGNNSMTHLKESGESEIEWQIERWCDAQEMFLPQGDWMPQKTEEYICALLDGLKTIAPETQFRIVKITKTPMEEVK